MSTKDKILDTVENLISKNNVNSFSLKDIAEELKISKGTIFYYYKSKDEIILDIMNKHFKELENDYFAWLNKHKDELLSKERFLEIIFYKGVELFNKAKIHIYLINECASGKPHLKEEYIKLWESWRNKLEIGIKQVFKEEIEEKIMSYLLMVIIDGLTIQQVLNPNNELNESIVKEIATRW